MLLIDEALATGDRSFQKRSEARIRELRKHAGTVFLVSHSNKSIRDTCDRVLWLERGELRMDGPTEEVLAGVRGVHRRPGQVEGEAQTAGQVAARAGQGASSLVRPAGLALPHPHRAPRAAMARGALMVVRLRTRTRDPVHVIRTRDPYPTVPYDY